MRLLTLVLLVGIAVVRAGAQSAPPVDPRYGKDLSARPWPEPDASSGHGQIMVVGHDEAATLFTNDEGQAYPTTDGRLSKDVDRTGLYHLF